MPFKDAERRNAYRRKRYAERREQDRDERNRRDREGRAAKRRAEREAVPDPERRDPWPHQRDLYDVLESSDPPRLLTVCKAARVGSTTVQLLPADAAAGRIGRRLRADDDDGEGMAGASRRSFSTT